jgi:HNH endonuclease
MGAKDQDGYGAFDKGRAHRFSWTLHRGPVPDGLCVLHNCPGGDNPTCVNPEHLWLGSNRDNIEDRERKGRGAKGSRIAQSVLTEEVVLRARALRNYGFGASEIAEKLVCSKTALEKALAGLTWRHI